MDILSKFPERLRELMSERGVNPPNLSRELDIKSNAVTRYLNGKHVPQFETFVAMLEFFDCSADFLLGLSEFPRRENQIFKPVPPFCTQFRTAMKNCDVSQYALQKKTHITWANFNKWLNGIRLPYPDSLVRIAEGLDCTVDFLLGRED